MEFSGPVPPPAFLEQYERISPGLASRMVSMAEAESVHRRQIESSVVESHCQDQRAFHSEVLRGQILATAITVVALVAGAYTAVSGHEWAGGVLGCAGIGGIAINLILGRNAKQESAPKPDAQPAAPKGRHRKA